MNRVSGTKILTMEDDSLVRASIVAHLEDSGYQVFEAANGREGLEVFHREKPHLVLLDLRMPVMDGIDVLAVIARESHETPVIVVSGMGTVGDAIKALKFGAWDYFTKPIHNMAVLEHAVNKALERAALLRENRRYREHLEAQVKSRTLELERRSHELEKAYVLVKEEIVERERAEKAIDRERVFLQSVIDGVVDPIMVIGNDYRILKMNHAARDFLDDCSAVPDDIFCHHLIYQNQEPCNDSGIVCPLREVRRTGNTATVVHEHTFAGGEKKIYEIEASPLWNEDGTLHGVIAACRNITERLRVERKLRENESRLYHLAHHDSLTGLPNRLLFQDRLQRAMFKAHRSGQQVALLFLDLDRFKNINDTLGHDVGDRLLQDVSGRLRDCGRQSDTVARLGGDEFAIILDDAKELKDIAVVAQKILQALAKPIMVEGFELYVTASIGISLYPADSGDVDGLMKCTDTAMYRAKDLGKNSYQFYTADMNTRAFELLLMEGSLRKALRHDQLVVYYQPQIDLLTGSLVGIEALLRWRHPEQGMISPREFIPLAEETGLIGSIGEWVMRTACTQNRAWQAAGYSPVRMAVNISARQFRQQDLTKIIAQVLDETGLEAKYLELELTESIVMQDAEATIAMLKRLNNMGVRLSIDDFGTGYSSLSYLKRFPISNLKIDQSFVHDITTDVNDAMIASSIIALAHSMDLHVIAEGVENETQLNFLRDSGCNHAQGYLLGSPTPGEDFVKFFNDRQKNGIV